MSYIALTFPSLLDFFPSLSKPCSNVHICVTADGNIGGSSVYIEINSGGKHRLPFGRDNCRLSHGAGVVHPGSSACAFFDRTRPKNSTDLWHCIQEAVSTCTVADTRRQMAVMRNPLAVTVSHYFYLLMMRSRRRGNVNKPPLVEPMLADQQAQAKELEDYVSRMLPTVCQWVALRYILFAGLMSDQSTLFWYDEAKADPVAWHNDWLDFVGLRLPPSVVEVRVKQRVTSWFLIVRTIIKAVYRGR